MTINDPKTLAELTALCAEYEIALVTNDVETLQRLFWATTHVIRFGVTENLHGIEEIEVFRQSRPSANLARKVTRIDITTFGENFGCVNLEFERERDGKITRGRQSQTWVRLAEGWRVVSAHVSQLA